MSPMELFTEGRLSEALAAQRAAVRDNPSDAARLFLCELLLFNGEWGEARRQLDALSADSEEMREYVAEYVRLIDAERKRQRLTIDTDPGFLADPPEHALLRLDAIRRLR